MRNVVTVFVLIFSLCVLAGCGTEKKTGDEVNFKATILEISGNIVTVEPLAGENILRSADRITFASGSLDEIGASAGDIVTITYTGAVMESYPAQINAVSWSIFGKSETITSTEVSNEMGASIEESELPEERIIIADHDEGSYHEETEKYYDYFMENNHVGMLLRNETGGEGFSDAEMAAYALCELIKLSEGRYDQTVGFSKEEIDIVTNKYFGAAIRNYENRMSTVIPETGNITSTGWGGNSLAFVLKELKTEPDGIYTGVFYQFNFGMDGLQSSTKADLLYGFFDNYTQPYLITIVFEEKNDENGEMYLRYYEVRSEGEAKPPYKPYEG